MSRSTLNTLVASNVLTGGRRTKAVGERAVYNAIIAEAVNSVDDADVAGGYMKISASGLVNISFIKSATPSGLFLKDDGTWSAAGGGTSGLAANLAVDNTTGGFAITSEDTGIELRVFDGGDGYFISSIGVVGITESAFVNPNKIQLTEDGVLIGHDTIAFLEAPEIGILSPKVGVGISSGIAAPLHISSVIESQGSGDPIFIIESSTGGTRQWFDAESGYANQIEFRSGGAQKARVYASPSSELLFYSDVFNVRTLSNNLSIGSDVSGVITMPNLGGVGTRMVVASAAGVLSTQAISTTPSLAAVLGVGAATNEIVITSNNGNSDLAILNAYSMLSYSSGGTTSTITMDGTGPVMDYTNGVVSGSIRITSSELKLAHNTLLNLDATAVIVQGLTLGKGGANVLTNTAFGIDAMFSNSTGASCVAIGYETLKSNLTSVGHVAIGRGALKSHTTFDGCTAIGYNTLTLQTSGQFNVAIGYNSSPNNLTGNGNLSLGTNSMFAAQTASDCTALGYSAMSSMISGTDNVAIGKFSMLNATVGPAQNTVIGDNSGYFITTQANNTIIGYTAGGGAFVGSDCTLIGRGMNLPATGDGQLVIGANGIRMIYGAATGDLTFYANLYVSSGTGLDTTATGGSDVLNIGVTNANVINYGNSSTVHNFLGTAIYELQVNSYVQDKLITLNYGGAVASGVAVGFEIEENSVITGWLKTSAGRNGYSFLAPANAAYTDFVFAASVPRSKTFQDSTSTIAEYGNNLSVFASTTSAQLAGVISDETGTGFLVFSASPTFTGTPILATPTATSMYMTGLAGNGYLSLPFQTVAPTTGMPVAGVTIFSNSGSFLAWSRNDGGPDTYVRSFASALTADRVYTLQDRNGTLADDTDLALKLDADSFDGLSKITVGTSAPGSPSVGDLWIDTN